MIRAIRAGILLFLCGMTPMDTFAEPADRRPVPDPMGYVSDHAGAIDAEWKARIRSVCQDLERKTGVEMVVVTVPTIAPFGSANEYASAIYQRWGIGTAQQDHGVLLLAVAQERRAAVVVGRALLGRITPQMIDRVGRQYEETAFRQGRYGEGLYRTAVTFASTMQDVNVGGESRVHAHLKGLGIWLTVFTAGGAFAFLWWISRPDLRHPYGRLRRGEFWGTGQGGFGGNFGGFAGGTSGEGLK